MQDRPYEEDVDDDKEADFPARPPRCGARLPGKRSDVCGRHLIDWNSMQFFVSRTSKTSSAAGRQIQKSQTKSTEKTKRPQETCTGPKDRADHKVPRGPAETLSAQPILRPVFSQGWVFNTATGACKLIKNKLRRKFWLVMIKLSKARPYNSHLPD